MSGDRRDARGLLADRAALEARHRRSLSRDRLATRAATVALIGGALRAAMSSACCVARHLAGADAGRLRQLGWFVGADVPADAGGLDLVPDLSRRARRDARRSPCSARCWRGVRDCRSAFWRRAMSFPAGVLHFLARRFLDTVRGVDTLIWALIWINVVGLGPFAGALAIASSDFGALRQAVVGSHRGRRPQAGRGRAARPAAAGCTPSASASCRRCCRSSPARCSISSNRTPARRPSSASSAPAASGCSCPSRSACWNGSRCRS